MGSLSPVVQLAMELGGLRSEDDEYDELVTKVALKLARQSRHRVPRYCEDVVSRYFDFEFKRLFRLSRDTLDGLVVRFEASSFYPSALVGRPQVSAEKTCLVALAYLGHQCCMYSLADRFDIAESSVQACVDRVLAFLNAISEEAIAWPNDKEKERCKATLLEVGAKDRTTPSAALMAATSRSTHRGSLLSPTLTGRSFRRSFCKEFAITTTNSLMCSLASLGQYLTLG